MFNDNAFPNAGSITGSGGAQITGSGIFLYLDYGEYACNSIAPYFIYQTGLIDIGEQVLNTSITGSGGAQITGSGIFLYLDYFQHAPNGILLNTGTAETGVAPVVVVFKPYAFFYKKY